MIASLVSRFGDAGAARVASRTEIAGALAFVDGALHGYLAEPEALGGWFDEHLVSTSRMPRPERIAEPGVGSVELGARKRGGEEQTAAIVRRAAARVLDPLRALIAAPSDDRFLSRLIFAGRARRVRKGRDVVWAARPRETDPLSDVVLSLFTVDILTNRRLYETALCVCDDCGRISFFANAALRRSCANHAVELCA